MLGNLAQGNVFGKHLAVFKVKMAHGGLFYGFGGVDSYAAF